MTSGLKNTLKKPAPWQLTWKRPLFFCRFANLIPSRGFAVGFGPAHDFDRVKTDESDRK
jgi:hypothetical protein